MTEFTLHIGSLIVKHFRDELNAAEAEELQQYLKSSSEAQQMFDEVNNAGYVAEALKDWNDHDYSALTAKIAIAFPAFNEPARQTVNPGSRTVHRVHFLKTAWFRWAAAIIILVGIGTYIFSHTSQPNKEVFIDQPSPNSNDVMPGSNKAILTLSNGEKIELNQTTSETINDGDLAINNHNGQLIYQSANSKNLILHPNKSGNPGLNTMSTPRGGQYQLILPDGSKVWLNAESSITFPTAFNGNTRTVNITGEAYFEVAKNARQPFIVKTIADQITVLGTAFNINTYTDEPAGKISLIEGAIKVGDTNIKPGQAYTNGKIIKTDIKRDIAWKNGYFNFEGADLPAVMRKLGRWYDIEVKFQGEIPKRKFRGELPRDLTLTQVLNVLRDINVNFEIKDKTLLVK